jgi:outer membrane autotransporter protein
VDGALSGGRARITTSRGVAIPGVALDGTRMLTDDFARTADSSHSAWTLGTQVDAGVDLAAGALALQPLMGLSYARYSQGALAEDGAGSVNLAIDAFTSGVARFRAGARIERATAGNARWRPEGQVIWSHALGTPATALTAGLRDASGRFRFDAPADARDELATGLGLVGRFGATSLRVRYDGRYARDWRSHGFTVAAALVF